MKSGSLEIKWGEEFKNIWQGEVWKLNVVRDL